MKIMVPCFVSFMITILATPLVICLAKRCNCLDIPGGRRMHEKPTPRWGGIAFFIGVLSLLVTTDGGGLTPYIAASLVLVIMGAIDDLRPLSWKIKFALMTIAATIVIFWGDTTVHQIGSYGETGLVELGWLSIPFTYIGIIGITNAINLLDGLNGLAGGVSLLGFLFMGIAAALAGNIPLALLCFSFVGALAAFLIYNFPKARVFMGDSGSTFLGFSLAVTAISLTQESGSSVNSMFPVLVLLIPIFDTLRVLLIRLLKGKNPFKADNLHLHYLIVENDISPAKAALMFWSLTAILGCIALTLTSMTSLPFLTVVLYAVVFLSLFAFTLTQRLQSQEQLRLKTLRPAVLVADPAGVAGYGKPGFTHKNQGERMMTLKWMVVLGVVLLAAQVVSGETTVLKTPKEKQSYGLGVDMGKNLKRQGSEMDLDVVLRGMKDVMNNDKLQMSDEELVSTMKNFAAERKARQQKEKPVAKQEDQTRIEDLETFYAIGLVLSRQLTSFNLSNGELELVKQGLTHALTGKGPDADLSSYAEKINILARERRKVMGSKIAESNKGFLDQAAKEKGAVKADSGVVYLPLKDGSGATPSSTDKVKVNYRGMFPDGKEFDNSYKRGEPLELKMDGVIKCWNEGLQKMKTGGKARLVCPPDTAYGEAGAGDAILPYATLVFEVELLEVKN
jgi:FKBP-type peptidyl-prolyl cis-trans isomerase FkpA